MEINSSQDERNGDDASSSNGQGDSNDSPAFRLRPRRSTPRSTGGSARNSPSSSLIFSRIRSQQQPADRPSGAAKRNLFSISAPNGSDDGYSNTDATDNNNGETGNGDKRTGFRRDIHDSIATDVLISPFMQRISVSDLKPDLKYEHNYITLQIKEVISNKSNSPQQKSQSLTEAQDRDGTPSNCNNNVKSQQQQSPTENSDDFSSFKVAHSDASPNNDCLKTNVLRLICIEPKQLFDSSFSDDGDISVSSNDTNVSTNSAGRRTSARKKRRAGSSLISPYESPGPMLSKDKLTGDTLAISRLPASNPQPIFVHLHGEYSRCPAKTGKMVNIAKLKTVSTSEADIKDLKGYEELSVNIGKVKSEDAAQPTQKSILINYKGTNYSCLPFHVEVRAHLDGEEIGSKYSGIENVKAKDLTDSSSWLPFLSITSLIDKPTDPIVEVSSSGLDKKNTDRELQQQKESASNGNRNQNGSNFSAHNELSLGESSDASNDDSSRHKKFIYNTHNTLKQTSESPDMKILLKPS